LSDRNNNRKREKRGYRKRVEIDEEILSLVKDAENKLFNSMQPVIIKNLNSFQRKQVYNYFENRNGEYLIKTYREEEDVIIKIYPVGRLRRLAEQKTQEVLMNGREEELPVMGAFERFIIHDYLKQRNGIKTLSVGVQGEDRRVKILPVFGRTLKKAKRKLTR